MELVCRDRTLDLSRTHVMGVLNVTPDSFSDGGAYFALEAAVEHARAMAAEGASIIDIGGESTRPGADSVSVDEELARVVPVIEELRAADVDAVISVDTSKAAVMRAAVAAGAGLINDVRALREPGALQAAAELNVPVCLMHMQGDPRTMQTNPRYGDVIADVAAFLSQRVAACIDAGIGRDRLLLDPGLGFGKTLEHNLTLLKHLDAFSRLRLPLVVGLSRKRLIGAILNADVGDRLYGSIAGAVIAAGNGARIIRAHDVRATVDAVRICDAVYGAE